MTTIEKLLRSEIDWETPVEFEALDHRVYTSGEWYHTPALLNDIAWKFGALLPEFGCTFDYGIYHPMTCLGSAFACYPFLVASETEDDWGLVALTFTDENGYRPVAFTTPGVSRRDCQATLERFAEEVMRVAPLTRDVFGPAPPLSAPPPAEEPIHPSKRRRLLSRNLEFIGTYFYIGLFIGWLMIERLRELRAR